MAAGGARIENTRVKGVGGIKKYHKSGCYKQKGHVRRDHALLEKFWRISMFVTEDAIAKLHVWNVKFNQIEGNGRTSYRAKQ